MKFPARKVAIVIWFFGAAFFVLQQMRYPIFERGMFETDRTRLTMIAALANAFLYPGVIAGLGAIVHLLGEIRDATPPRKEPNP